MWTSQTLLFGNNSKKSDNKRQAITMHKMSLKSEVMKIGIDDLPFILKFLLDIQINHLNYFIIS